ncbi:hypothetical protein C1645_821920 [Glomus cerebriforme]|uniref:Ion transport domain-containing protein n=1 Tax=Glomus cerebriforme TaxID=658196 RepID=A0A397T105_9GLOM|nr:hypothetical protein C1645_821920 [Glomus cerebriforme]
MIYCYNYFETNKPYKYNDFDKLSDPDEEFINEIKKVFESLYDIDNMNDVKDIDSLMIFIQKNLMKKSKKSEINELNDDQQTIYPEIYNESDIKWKNDELIRKLINCCLRKNKESKHKFMLVISHLLPILVEKSYKNLVEELVKELTYVKVPQEWFREKNKNHENFLSIHEDLWGYRFPKHKTKKIQSSIFDRFEREPRHHVTLCYVPLPGLCTFPDDDNNLFPGGLSPFIKLIMSNNDEVLDDKHTSTKIFESPFFHAIIKFKWHLFGRAYHLLTLFMYIIFFILFVSSITLDFNKRTNIFNAIKDYSGEIIIAASKSYIAAITATIGDFDNVTNSIVNNLTIAEAVKSNIDVITATIYNAALDAEAKLPDIDIVSAIYNATIEAINNTKINDTIITSAINNVTIAVINNNYKMEIKKAINMIELTAINEAINSIDGRQLMIVCIILVAIGILFIIRYIIILVKNGLGKQCLVSTYFLITLKILIIITGLMELKLLDYGLEILGVFQSISLFLIWFCLFWILFYFKNIGVFAIVIIRICRKTLCLIFLLVIILFAVAHSTMVYFSTVPPEFDDDKNVPKENTFENYVKSFDNEWIGFTSSSYEFLDSWKINYLVILVKILFSLFTSIIIMNLLIAVINNIYDDVYQRAYTEWTVVRARLIAFIELAFSLPKDDFFINSIFNFTRKNKDYFPPTIIYEVSAEKIKEWNISKTSNIV